MQVRQVVAGTITQGAPKVTSVYATQAHKFDEKQLLQLAASTAFTALPGAGIEARCAGIDLILGNEKMMRDKAIDCSDYVAKVQALAKSVGMIGDSINDAPALGQCRFCHRYRYRCGD